MNNKDIREAFNAACNYFIEVVQAIPDDKWDAPGLGEWSIRDLVGHAGRSMSTPGTYAANHANEASIADAPAYFITVSPSANAGLIAERGREAGAELGDNPAESIAKIAACAIQDVAGLSDSLIMSIPAGNINLIKYLPTRIFEVIIHAQDICDALGLPHQPPEEPLAITLNIVAELAIRGGQGSQVATALTGRHQLEKGFSVLG